MTKHLRDDLSEKKIAIGTGAPSVANISTLRVVSAGTYYIYIVHGGISQMMSSCLGLKRVACFLDC